MFHSCIVKDSTKQPQIVALITDRSHWHNFFCAVVLQHENSHNWQIYEIIFCLIRFKIDSMWPH
jgi:hypothetical protein